MSMDDFYPTVLSECNDPPKIDKYTQAITQTHESLEYWYVIIHGSIVKPFIQDQNIAHIFCDKIFLVETVVWNVYYVVFAWLWIYAILKAALNSLVVDLCMENPFISFIAQGRLVRHETVTGQS